MRTEDFDYRLPPELIATEPAEPRDACRLLVMSGTDGAVRHYRFSDLPGLLNRGDRLVFNNTRVLPARLFTRKSTGGRVELFFVEKSVEEGAWKALVRPASRVPEGTVLAVEEAPDILLKITDKLPDGSSIVRPENLTSYKNIEDLMQKYGHMPLPHYIRRKDKPSDRENYQTIYAEKPGAVAAPTAGLHFTDSLMERLRASGIDFSYLTLHIGIGTFRPVKVADPRRHKMHKERFILSSLTAEEIENTRKRGGRIIAVGTTVVRVLEHCIATYGRLLPCEEYTDLMIIPPYRFKAVDGIITNFHLPKSTLLMLVCAFGGMENVLKAYQEAVKRSYRFYSYGDAMLII